VLRYWEQEFTQLRPVKRRGNRRYYQHHEVLMIRRIRALLYEQGFTISGARLRLQEGELGAAMTDANPDEVVQTVEMAAPPARAEPAIPDIVAELIAIRELLTL
jgi:DNA-binding transcriptional MerR regulator